MDNYIRGKNLITDEATEMPTKRFKAFIRGSVDFSAGYTFKTLESARKASEEEAILAEPHIFLDFSFFDKIAYHCIDDDVEYDIDDLEYDFEEDEVDEENGELVFMDYSGSADFEGEIIFDAYCEEDALRAIDYLNTSGPYEYDYAPCPISMDLCPIAERAVDGEFDILNDLDCMIYEAKVTQLIYPEGEEMPPLHYRIVK